MRWSGAVAGLGALAVLVPACSAGDGSDSVPPSRTATITALPVDDPAGPAYPLPVPRGRGPVVAAGDDWSMPGWARPAAYSGFFSEDASPADHIPVRSVDVSWAQVRPTEDGPLDLTSSGEAQGMFFDPLGEQLDQDGPYWVRMFSSGVEWAPEWVVDKCQVGAVGTDYDGQQHLPIWDDCVWTELSDTWRRLLVDQGLLDDPEFRFAYVPGGFTWSEYDYEMISAAVRRGELTQADYLAWYDRMLDDFVDLAGPRVGQLVFTGEDYPWGPFGRADDLLATRAVRRGLGVRTGITEEFNFHLNETPAYGSRVGPDCHLFLSRPEPEGLQVFGTENECYVDCGFSAQDPAYDVVQSNLKALQLQMNWVYVVPGASLLDPQARHWDWVRLSRGRTPESSPDAWAALRDAEDTFWRDTRWPFPHRPWPGRPFVRNLERWVVQVDAPGAVAHRSTADVHRGDPTRENGVSYEGLRTDRAAGDTSLAFRVDQRFLSGERPERVLVKVTYLDRGAGSFRLRHAGGRTPPVRLQGGSEWKTATWAVRVRADHTLPRRTDLWVDSTGADLTVRFVRIVRLHRPTG